MARPRDWRLTLLVLSLVVFLLDRLTKAWIVAHVPVGTERVVIPGFFRISHVLNTGAAFSMFAESPNMQHVRWGLIIFSIAVALLMLALVLKLGKRITPSTVAFALVLGGACGNLVDRVRTGQVVDFIQVHIVHYHYPDFNIADSAIVIGGILIVGDALRPQKKKRQPVA